jgi:hypothetical protein
MKWQWFGSPQILKVLHNPTSACFFSFLIGFGLIVLLLRRPTGIQKNLSMSVEDVESKVVRHGEKCYKFRAEDTKCEKVSSK